MPNYRFVYQVRPFCDQMGEYAIQADHVRVAEITFIHAGISYARVTQIYEDDELVYDADACAASWKFHHLCDGGKIEVVAGIPGETAHCFKVSTQEAADQILEFWRERGVRVIQRMSA